MAAPTQYATAEGSLYELVSRGNKDVFFHQDLFDSSYAFDNQYAPQAPSSFEVRRVPPTTACEFGRTVQFDFDLVGDVMQNPTLIIRLPTWLPPTIAPYNSTSVITDLSGVSYGYTNGIAYFLFEQIQFYQDNILLQEFSGDALWAVTKATGTYGHTFVTNELTGQDNGSSLSIGRRATPGQLRLPLPMIGTQLASDPGFPQRAVQQHSYRLKCKLRRLEDLVEASDLPAGTKPQPWGRTFQQITSANATPITFTTLPRESILPPELFLETTQVYLPREYQEELQNKPQKVAFTRLWENRFTQNQLDYAGVVAGGTSVVTRRLDARHPSGRVVWFFRSIADVNANRLWKINTGIATQESYFNSISLQIAGLPRELPRSSQVWRDVTNFAKEEIDTGDEINSMNWTLGHIAPQRFPDVEGQPTGAVNFTTADRPTFYIDLSQPPADPLTGAPNTELRVIVEGWARFDTDGKGRAELFSGN
jgi:hypothetical protein